MDSKFRVEVISQSPNPQQTIWLAMHQCVAEGPAADAERPSEIDSGVYSVKHLLAGNRGHYSPLEAPQISFNIIDFPHSAMQQVRTHRVGVHFSVQSFRYSGQRIVDVATGKLEPEDVFYLRPEGTYTDRQGKRYEYTEEHRNIDHYMILIAARHYSDRIQEGFPEEHARGLIPFDIRQHWVMSANVRSLMHILDLRWKADAQLECQQLCELIWPHFEAWVPEIAEWYKANRMGKARLAP